jgi:hypothetical protein
LIASLLYFGGLETRGVFGLGAALVLGYAIFLVLFLCWAGEEIKSRTLTLIRHGANVAFRRRKV